MEEERERYLVQRQVAASQTLDYRHQISQKSFQKNQVKTWPDLTVVSLTPAKMHLSPSYFPVRWPMDLPVSRNHQGQRMAFQISRIATKSHDWQQEQFLPSDYPTIVRHQAGQRQRFAEGEPTTRHCSRKTGQKEG